VDTITLYDKDIEFKILFIYKDSATNTSDKQKLKHLPQKPMRFILMLHSTFKGILPPKMKILSLFTDPQVVANLYEFLSSAEHKGRYFEERFEPNSCLAPLTSI